jgi:acid phosphatase family membrane protein YuiD
MWRDSAYMWIAPLVAMVVAQILKPILIMIQARRFDWQRMRQSGGMPSSHTALVVALVVELWLRYGGRNPILALGLFIAIVVMYDAAGVRWQTGRQAALLNRLLHDLKGQNAVLPSGERMNAEASRTNARVRHMRIAKVPWWLMDWPVLNEHVGHKPREVLGGCVVGIAIALLLH